MGKTCLVLAVSLAVLGIGLVPAHAQAPGPAVDKLVADWTAAFERGDAKALAGLYTEEAIRVTGTGATIGRAAIEKEFATNFGQAWKGAKIRITTGKTSTIAPDIAVAEGTYEVTATLPDGKPAPPAKGRYVNTIVKKNGAWLLASNAAVPPPGQ